MHDRGPNYIVGLMLTDVVLTLLALLIATRARLSLPIGVPLTAHWVDLQWGVYLLAVLVWLSVSAALQIYAPRRPYVRFEEYRLVIEALLLTNLAFAGALYITYRNVSRLLFLYALILQATFMLGTRLVLNGWRRFRHNNHEGRRTLIIGAGRIGQELARRINTEDTDLTLVGFLDDDPDKSSRSFENSPVLGPTGDATRLVKERDIQEVIFALPLRAHRFLESLIIALQDMPVRVRVVPDFFDLAFFRATIEDFNGIPLVGLRDPAIDGTNRVIKRVFDLTIAGVGLVLMGPIMAAVAIAIRLDSPGPAVFKQQRVGENGRLFTIYKFRSMAMDAESRVDEVITRDANNGIVHKRRDDPRVTRVGRFIRRTSLDELPQLFNVLKGEMSLVGPRPELPWLVDQYETWQRRRFAVPPGITGWWQVNGRSDRPMHMSTDDDLYYIQNYSPWLDLRILWLTVGVVLREKGAF